MLWRWLESENPQSPQANMAIDSELLHQLVCGEDALPTVRVYAWDRPCVSSGRLQNADAVRRAFPGLPIVPRPTGGLAVFHQNDLTFSIVTRQHWLPDSTGGVLASYRRIVGGMLPAFESLSIRATLGAGRPDSPRGSRINCFAVAAGCDVVDASTGRKLMGCAQRRVSGVILQQMTIPLTELGPNLDRKSFVCRVKRGLEIALGVSEWVAAGLDKANFAVPELWNSGNDAELTAPAPQQSSPDVQFRIEEDAQ